MFRERAQKVIWPRGRERDLHLLFFRTQPDVTTATLDLISWRPLGATVSAVHSLQEMDFVNLEFKATF